MRLARTVGREWENARASKTVCPPWPVSPHLRRLEGYRFEAARMRMMGRPDNRKA